MPSELIRFSQALEKTKGKDKSLLLGNGFSVAQTRGQFSYTNLLAKSGLTQDMPTRRVFDVLRTVDFEEVIHALEHAAKIEDAYGDNDKKTLFENGADSIREALISAIRAVHPPVQFEIPPAEIKACGNFLEGFCQIFTLNYDLLMYWVNLNRQPIKHFDGFGLGEERSGFRSFSENAHCSIYNLHGGLHLFQNNTGETVKRVSTGATIISDIENTIRAGRRLPLFVAEGTSLQKLGKINSVPYLRHSLDVLKSQAAPLFIFGHSAHENDEHIYDAIFKGKTPEIYFCVFDPDRNWLPIQERLARFKVRSPITHVYYVDASDMDIWGHVTTAAAPAPTAIVRGRA